MSEKELPLSVEVARNMRFLDGPDTGSYRAGAGVDVPHVLRSLDISIRTSLVKYSESDSPSKQAIILYMGGPNENRGEYSGFPSAICAITGMTVFSVAYLGSIQDPMRTEGTAEDIAELLDISTGKLNWQRMGDEILDLLREFVRPNYQIMGTVCHSFGMIPAVAVAMQTISQGSPSLRHMTGHSFVAIEPYLPAVGTSLRESLPAKDLEMYGYPTDGPFQYGTQKDELGIHEHWLSHFLHRRGVVHQTVLLAGGFRSSMSQRIAEQVDSTYHGFDIESVPNCNHGMNLKKVDLSVWKMTEEEVVESLQGLLRLIYESLF